MKGWQKLMQTETAKYQNSLLVSQMRLIDASLGLRHNLENHETIGIIDKEQNTLDLNCSDRQYKLKISSLNQVARKTIANVPQSRFAVSRLALQCLNSLDPTKLKQSSCSRKQLQDAFFNEILFQSNMEKYLKQIKPQMQAEQNLRITKDQLRHLVDKHSFEQSFNDGIAKLNNELNQTHGQDQGLIL